VTAYLALSLCVPTDGKFRRSRHHHEEDVMHTRAVVIGAVLAIMSSVGPAGAQAPAQREASAPAEIKAKLEAMRRDIRQKRLSYRVGYTRALDKPRAALLGDVDDPLFTPGYRREVQRRATELIELDDKLRRDALLSDPRLRRTLPDIAVLRLACRATNISFSWRAAGKVTPVKDQSCGNCWAFAALGAYEASDRIRNNRTLDSSEQYINDCGRTDGGVDAGSCGGGLGAKALEHIVRDGSVAETTVPYAGTDNACTNPATPQNAVAWGFVDPAVEFPTRRQIKEALCKYGPLTTRMRVVSDNLFAFTGTGVYSENVVSDADGGGHAVVIVGWSDLKKAWLIKNSWGTDWGDGGFGWLAYTSNRIGRHTTWIKAASTFYSYAPIADLKARLLEAGKQR
jgi:cathepsin L